MAPGRVIRTFFVAAALSLAAAACLTDSPVSVSPLASVAVQQPASSLTIDPPPSPVPSQTPTEIPPTAVPTAASPAVGPQPTPSPASQARPPTPPAGAAAAPSPTPTATRTPAPQPTATATRISTLSCKPHSFPQRTQQSLAVDPTNHQKVYIGIEQEGFFRSIDGGATWVRASNGFKTWPRLEDPSRPCFEEFYSTIIDPKDPDRICTSLAGSPGLVSLISSAGNNGVYCSEDAAITWTQRIAPAMNTAVYALVADPTDFNVMSAAADLPAIRHLLQQDGGDLQDDGRRPHVD